jgi:hypothetical protein
MGATGAVKRPLTTGLPSGFGGKPGWQASRRSRSPRSPCGWCVPPTFSRISIGSRVRPHRVASDKSTLDHQPGRRALRDRHGRGNVAVEMGVRQYHRRSPYVSFSTTAARPGKRHGHPRRGRRAGLRSEYRHPLRPAGQEFLCLPASAEPHGGAARIRLFRIRRNERIRHPYLGTSGRATPWPGLRSATPRAVSSRSGSRPHEPRAHDTYCSA